MSQISTIFWDVGGVLLTNGWDHNERDAVLGRFGVERDEFERRHAEANDPWEKGLISTEEYLNRTVFWKQRDFTWQEIFEAIKAESKVLPNTALEILQQLAASEAFELAIVNNESKDLNDFRIRKFDFLNLFDAFISSCYVGLRKPDTKIYRLALDVLQREPDEVAFIDDREKNVAAANETGIHGIEYKNAAQLASELEKLGISVPA